MPPYLTHIENWKALWPLPVAAAVLSLVIYLLSYPKEGKREIIFLLLAFTMLGIAAGYLTGLSREPAVGAVLPAALSLIGGFAVFLIGKDSSSRTVISLSVFAFALALVLGTSWGAVMRDTAERYAASEDYLMRQADIEYEIRRYRQVLGLPETPQ